MKITPGPRAARQVARRVRAIGATLLATAVLAAGCGSGSEASGSAEVPTVRYQSYAGTIDLVQFADALGELEGIKLKKIGDVTGGPQTLQALASDQVDVSASSFFGAIAQVVATGVPIKTVVSVYGANDKVYSAVVTLDDSGVRTARDLIGKKVAVNTLGGNAEALISTWLGKEGLSADEIKKVTLVPLPPLNTEQALREGQIDAAYLNIGNLNVANKRGGIREIVKDTDVVGSYNAGGLSMRTDYIKNNAEAAKILVTGVGKAIDYLESHTADEAFAIYDPWLEENGFSDYIEAIHGNWAGSTGVASAGGAIKEADISLWLDWLGSRGDIDTEKIKPADVFTNELNAGA